MRTCSQHVTLAVDSTLYSIMKAVFVALVCVVAVARAGLLGGTYTALTAPALAHALPAAHVPAAVNVVASPIALAAPYAHGAALAAPLHVAPAPVAAPVAAVAAHYAAPAVVAAPALPAHAAPAVVAAPVAHGAAYKAVTRGAVHTAPLPGHIVGSAHVNVAPAPGTW